MSVLRTATRSLVHPRRLQLSPLASASSASSYSTSSPTPPAPVPSKQPTSSSPAHLQQSPNVPKTWSTGQNPKPNAYDNVRFEQTSWEFQPNSPSAMGMVAEDPVRLVEGRKAVCDGGGGALGHPKIFINLDKPGPKACGYCGIRYEQSHHTH
ncbi:hypothetical protein CI109_102150 [Kwoniella shandongensis]|uniref:Uncharacterized protein n=1 Tax=Kwoniella shandongensis TaxID=1734106 RepID=A0A5M6BYY3_9TREE|nr:uncharacterized protein CI109_003691 [Kwoniella shandongensis]KAA5528036.1 hypothetical protein CI109_003691 [Kwoniella shandongensis]